MSVTQDQFISEQEHLLLFIIDFKGHHLEAIMGMIRIVLQFQLKICLKSSDPLKGRYVYDVPKSLPKGLDKALTLWSQKFEYLDRNCKCE